VPASHLNSILKGSLRYGNRIKAEISLVVEPSGRVCNIEVAAASELVAGELLPITVTSIINF